MITVMNGGLIIYGIEENNMTPKEELKIYKKSIESLKEMIKIQCSDGNWNYDPYMHGMANGMIFALHLFSEGDKSPEYLEAPKVWLCDIPTGDIKPVTVSTEDMKMKNHLIFCCNETCEKFMFNRFMDSLRHRCAVANSKQHFITHGMDRFMFFSQINNNPDRLRGLDIYDYEVCGEYDISDEVKYICKSAMNRRRKK